MGLVAGGHPEWLSPYIEQRDALWFQVNAKIVRIAIDFVTALQMPGTCLRGGFVLLLKQMAHIHLTTTGSIGEPKKSNLTTDKHGSKEIARIAGIAKIW
jgi:hypothetical protein